MASSEINFDYTKKQHYTDSAHISTAKLMLTQIGRNAIKAIAHTKI